MFMKESLNVLLNNQLIKLWQQITRKGNVSTLYYNLQTIPSYRKMIPFNLPVSKTRKAMPFLSGLIILLAVSISFSSCFTSGYGCKGHSRIITRVR